MSKLQQFKEAVKNPRPDRLAQIEYRSHFMQMLGVSTVCLILILKGLWYIIFAFVFSLGISYSQGMSSYMKYKNIVAIMGKEPIEDYEKDVSPTRKRSKIINHVFGSSAKWASIIVSVLLSFVIIGVERSRLILSLSYPILTTIFFVLFYFFLFYWVANLEYKKEINLK